MHPSRRRFLVGAALLTLGASTPGLAAAQSVRSVGELRRHQVVIQEFDISCAAAALATLLTYQHGDPVTEREIALGLIDRPEYIENPALIRLRQGFSLLDLKRFVDGRGYEGIGFGQLTYDDLFERAPIIVPLDLHGFRHFVIFRGELGGSVLLADPAYGNRTMSRERFERAWIDFPRIGRVGFVVERRDGLIPPNRLEPTLAEFLVLR
ncbi:MAG: peptidase C39 [Geminicoccaceae bacterium]|nr:peptidase C39 [Geminicoccaceae bacterium]